MMLLLHIHFNSQPHEEADLFSLLCIRSWIYFNSQPHEEADAVDNSLCTSVYISTHSLTKRLTGGKSDDDRKDSYFNSQPHEEADDLFGCCLNGNCISTHSLTKRLTTMTSRETRRADYFNSQPHEEADSYAVNTRNVVNNFNSQPHEEADQKRTVSGSFFMQISTHSLTKRLTLKPDSIFIPDCVFQLTASRRG